MADKRFQMADAEQVWIRDSDVKGPTAIILGGIHGDERPGIATIRRMKSGKFSIPLERGRLIIALGNLDAMRENRRFTEGGTNLNREFKNVELDKMVDEAADLSSEGRRARALRPYLDESDGALDMHAFRQHDGRPFMITEPRGFLAALAVSHAGARYVSSGWGGSKGIEQGGTDDYMEQRGKIGLCFELSQLRDFKHGVPRAMNGVMRFLAYMELIDPANVEVLDDDPVPPLFVHAAKAVLASENFAWATDVPYRSFQSLSDGEFIAQNGSDPTDRIFAGPDQVIIFPYYPKAGQPIMRGDEMFNLGTKINNPLQLV